MMLLRIILAIIFHQSIAIDSPSIRFKVSESAPIGYLIGSLGDSSGSANEPRFIIVYPDEQTAKFIKIDETSGEIRTILPLDYEKRIEYTIVALISANGTTVDVTIEVLDENDNAPQFSQDISKLEISELAQIGSVYALPQAHDADGPLYDVHQYSILYGNVNNVFKIVSRRVNEQLQADLVVNGKLDREFRDKYELSIEAEDGGSPPRSARLRLIINIIDANDNPPIFGQSRYIATISSNSTSRDIVQVSASDADIGENSRVTYELRQSTSPSSKWFSIDADSGMIRLSEQTSLVSGAVHDLVVVASDHGRPTLSSTCVVTVNVVGSAPSPPPIDVVWLVASGVAHLLENQTIGSIVARVSVAEDYINTNLKLTGCDALCPQQTDKPHVYLLVLCGLLDRETIKEYHMRLVLEATNGTTILDHPILLTIGDINDNAPQWDAPMMSFALNRTSGLTSRVLTAHDADESNNGWIRYKVLDTSLVSIDEETGRLYVPETIDCHTTSELKFRVRAEDGGSPALSSDLQVTAELIDDSAQPPQFDKTFYQVELPEDTPTGTCILKVSAGSSQCSSSRVRYAILDDVQGRFSIDAISGVICVTRRFDYETMRSHRITIRAFIGDLQTTALVVVMLTDINDNWPIFEPIEYRAALRPDSPVRLRVAATDLDSGAFGEVRYQLLSESSLFQINATTGELAAKRALLPGRYHLIVTAIDSGGIRAEHPASIHINVLDSDCAPQFSRHLYHFRVAEDILPGISVGSISVNSDDVRFNFYGSAQSSFRIHPTSGKIEVTSYIDADVKETIILNVEARKGDCLNYTQVLINLEDHNDNAPMFDVATNEIFIREDVPLNEPFYGVHAIDKDRHMNGQVTYSIISTRPASTIQIDAKTGQLYTESPLDYEEAKDYAIRIKAKDGGMPPKSTNTTIVIRLIDVNDNSPVFDETSYRMSIVENSPTKTIVGSVRAVDIDTAENGHVVYGITNGSEFFGIDEKLGNIYSKRSIDRESISSIDLTIFAEDRGTPKRRTTTSVRVDILDVNDNAPSCHTIQPIVVAEDASPSKSIATIVAADSDKGSNGSVVYRSQLFHPLFVIKSNGDVFLRQRIQPNDTRIQRISIIASDEGRPPKSAVCHIVVRISNGDSRVVLHSETEKNLVYDWERCANSPCRLTRINASGVSSWLIQSSDVSNHFTINDGTITMTSIPSRPPPYSLVVIMSDGSGRQTSISLRIMSSKPLLNDEYQQTLEINRKMTPIGTRLGSLAMQVLPEIIYKPNSVNCPLDVDEIDGSLTLLDYPKNNSETCLYSRINVTSGVEKIFKVELDLKEQAAERPKFAKNIDEVDVYEDQLIGSIVYTPSASVNSLTYRLTSHSEQFSIDPVTGHLTIIETLNWSKCNKYYLTIEGISSKYSTTMLLIVNVIDVNNNAPKIISGDNVVVSSKIGPILRLIAVDADQNSSTSFEILKNEAGLDLNINEDTLELLKPCTPGKAIIIVRAIDSENPELFSDQTISIDCHIEQTARMFLEKRVNISTNVRKGEVLVDLGTKENLFMPLSAYFGLIDGKIIAKRGSIPANKYLMTVIETATSNWAQVEISAVGKGAAPVVLSSSCGMTRVRENLKLNGPLKRIMATGDQVSFKFQGKPQNFTIDEATGEIRASPLDREARQEHLLVVIASNPYGNDSCTIRVLVEDDNDNPPRFQTLPSEIDETTRINASDHDVGMNGRIVFSLTSDESKSLDIDPNSGQLIARRNSSLDSWWIRVRASDMGSPQLSDEVRLLVKKSRMVRNETTPVFLRKNYVALIDEGLPRGEFVEKLEVSDGRGWLFAIVDGNRDEAFTIDDDGIVRTNLELDAEIVDAYRLKVIATGSAGYQTSTTVEIVVGNLNDNKPFITKPMARRISEATTVAAYVATVEAKDVDGLQPLEYYLDTELDHFHIDRYTGIVHLISPLDYETKQEHQLKIRVTDGEHETTTFLTIGVGDVNDEVPRFSKPFYNIELSYDSFNPAEPIAQIAAIDNDDDDLVYSINDDPTGLIRVDPANGSIFIGQSSNETLICTLTVKDKAVLSHSTNVPIRINFVDRIRDTPTFEQSIYRFNVDENCAIGTLVGKLSSNLSSNYHYHISNDESNRFRIDNSGRLFVNGLIDRELVENYDLKVEVSADETSVTTSTCRVAILVNDKNDNLPVFDKSSYQFELKDGLKHDQQIGTIRAIDADKDDYISYSILSGNDDKIVTLSADNGRLSFNEWPADLSATSWKLIIAATDSSGKVATTEALVTVRMTAWSATAPFFVFAAYNIHVAETTKPGDVIRSIRATTRLGTMTEMPWIYTLNDASVIGVNSSSGVIYLKSELNWEIQTRYEMQLSVRDNHGRSAVVPLNLLVTPIDEYAPIFRQPSYTFCAPWSASKGYQIGTIEAIDDDGGVHGIVHYSLLSDSQFIRVDASSGRIYLTQEAFSLNLTSSSIQVIGEAESSGGMRSNTSIRIEFVTVQDQIARGALILISLLAGLIAVLVVVVVMCMRRKPKEKKPMKTVYSVQTGRVLTEEDAMKRSHIDSGIEQDDSASVNSSISDFMASVSGNPMPNRSSIYDDPTMNIYAKVDDLPCSLHRDETLAIQRPRQLNPSDWKKQYVQVEI